MLTEFMNYPTYKKTNKTGLPWVPVVPAHWEIKRLRFLAEGIEQGWSPQCNNYPAEGDEWGVLKVGCVNGHAFNPQENKQLPADLEPRLEYQIQLGDILISRANTRELLGSAGIVDKLTAKLLLCDKLYRLRVNDTIDKRFLVNYLRSKAARAHYECEATGTSGSMQNIGQDTIATLSVPLPPLDEQKAIVAFLDEQTARLDALLARQHCLLRLLAEKRTALITQVVTQGLHADAPRQPSGVAWLGEVPAHWEVKRLRYLIDKIRGGGTPSTQTPEYWDGPLPWVSPKDMKSTYISKTQDYVTELALKHSVIELVSPGSILIVVRSGILKHTFPACINIVPVTINQDLKALTPKANTEAKFLRYLLKAYEKDILNFCSKIGATVDSIEIDDLLNFVLVLPPLKEQEEISSYLDLEVSKLDAVTKAVKKAIAKLQEYRAALITAAVTGQIDVRAAVTAEAA